MSLITNQKYNNDYMILAAIERGIRGGETLYIIRMLDQNLNKWKREVFQKNQIEESPVQNKSLYDELSVINGFASDTPRSNKLADLRELNLGHEVKKVAIEVVQQKMNLLVCGAGHVGQAVGLMGSLLGYNVVIVDDRSEFTTRSRFPDRRIQLLAGDYSIVLKNIEVNSNSAIVIVTRGHQFDEVCLRLLLTSDAGYLGMIGSKRRTISIINRLKNDGFPENLCERVYAPIGLPIGAKSPQEIAIAIHAEIINCFNNKALKQ